MFLIDSYGYFPFVQILLQLNITSIQDIHKVILFVQAVESQV